MNERAKSDVEAWYHLYSEALVTYIYMMTRDYDQAEDLVHETFINAFRSYASFKGEAQVKTWLFSIAHNVTMDYLRKQKPLRLIEKVINNRPDSKPPPADVLQIKEDVQEVYTALGRLKPSYREVIILRKVKGFSIRETSTILDWSENQVKVTLHRAMPKLHEELKREGSADEKR